MNTQQPDTMTTEVSNDCSVCLSPFTSSVRKPIPCQFCKYEVCLTCVKKYMLTTPEDPHCMNCRKAWNRDFIDSQLSVAFRKGALKKHREDILLDREKARLPLLQYRVEARVKAQEINKEIVAANRALNLLETQVSKARTEVHRLYNRQHRYQQVASGQIPPNQAESENGEKKEIRQFTQKCPVEDCRGFLSSQWKCGTCQIWVCPDCLVPKGKDKETPHTCDEATKATAALIKKETKPCPKCGMGISKIDGCFAKDTPILLWDANYCNAQDIKVGDILVGDDGEPRVVEDLCSGGDEMFEITQGKGMTYVVNSKHKLALINAHNEVIEITVDDYNALLDSEKGSLLGFKYNPKKPEDELRTGITVKPVGQGTYYGWCVSGKNKRFLLADFTVARNCDQMWCVACQTPFSWTTGRQVFGVVHNPHYYQWLREQNNGQAPRLDIDIPCGGLVGYYQLQRNLPNEFKKIFEAIHRITAEIHDNIIRNYPRLDEVPDNGDLGVEYTLKNIDLETWKHELWKRETKREKGLDIRGPLDLFVNVTSEILRRVALGGLSPQELQDLLQQILALRKYVNTELEKIGVRYANMVPQITECWRWDAFGGNRREEKETRDIRERILLVTPENDKLLTAQQRTELNRIIAWALPLPDENGSKRYGVDGSLFGGLTPQQREIVRFYTGEKKNPDLVSAALQKV